MNGGGEPDKTTPYHPLPRALQNETFFIKAFWPAKQAHLSWQRSTIYNDSTPIIFHILHLSSCVQFFTNPWSQIHTQRITHHLKPVLLFQLQQELCKLMSNPQSVRYNIHKKFNRNNLKTSAHTRYILLQSLECLPFVMKLLPASTDNSFLPCTISSYPSVIGMIPTRIWRIKNVPGQLGLYAIDHNDFRKKDIIWNLYLEVDTRHRFGYCCTHIQLFVALDLSLKLKNHILLQLLICRFHIKVMAGMQNLKRKVQEIAAQFTTILENNMKTWVNLGSQIERVVEKNGD